jgi:hypothetical protein
VPVAICYLTEKQVNSYLMQITEDSRSLHIGIIDQITHHDELDNPIKLRHLIKYPILFLREPKSLHQILLSIIL